MSYQVVIPKPVQKQLDGLPDAVYDRIIKQIKMLEEHPRPRGCIKLKGYENEYRIRVGNYRAVSYDRPHNLIISYFRANRCRMIPSIKYSEKIKIGISSQK